MKKLLFFFTVMIISSTLCITIGCSQSNEEAIPFHIDVIPEQLNGHSIAGQHCVFLVTITDEGQTSEVAVEISATASSAEIIIYKKDIVEGQVAEVVVIPTQGSIGKTIEVTIQGSRGGLSDEEVISFEVVEGEDDRGEYVAELRDKFVSCLELNHPELGITSNTEWTGTVVSPQWLIVSHYLFFSEEWEMHVEWHVMIPPYDWAKIDLYSTIHPNASLGGYHFDLSSNIPLEMEGDKPGAYDMVFSPSRGVLSG